MFLIFNVNINSVWQRNLRTNRGIYNFNYKRLNGYTRNRGSRNSGNGEKGGNAGNCFFKLFRLSKNVVNCEFASILSIIENVIAVIVVNFGKMF